MKNLSFGRRLGFALSGLVHCLKAEPSFRIQLMLALGAISILVVEHASAVWWAIVALTIGAVCAAELINTALELLLDHLHPEHHPMIGQAKDCAAAAVLVLSASALAVLIALVLR